jgi:cell division septation protein DedD
VREKEKKLERHAGKVYFGDTFGLTASAEHTHFPVTRTMRFFLISLLWAAFVCVPAPLPAAGLYEMPPGASGPAVYTFQVETLSIRANAEAHTRKLRQQGYPAYICVFSTQDDRQLFKIRIGSYAAEQEARAAVQAYTTRTGRPAFLVQTSAEDRSFPPSVADPARSASAPAAPARDRPVAVPPSRAAGEDYFTVQTATVRDRALAERHRRQLADRGLDAYSVSRATADGTALYKIRFGRFASEGEADDAARIYEREQGTACLVVQSRRDISAVPPPGAVQPAAGSSAAPAAVRDADTEPDQEPVYYTIQTATEIEKGPAEQFLQRLRDKGYPAYMLEKPTTAGRTLYQIRFGRYLDEASARAAARSYSETEKRDHLVVRSQVALDPALTARQPAISPAPVTSVRPLAADSPVAVADGDWPAKTTTIYGYRWPEDELNLTNTYERIPPNLRHTIEYVSVYPVRYLGPGSESESLLVESTTHGRQAVRLAGVTFPSPAALERLYAHCAEHYRTVPLRLKYNPNAVSGARAVIAQIHLKDGEYINREVLSQGLGVYCPETVVPGQEHELQQAVRGAQAGQRGMWAEAE